MRRVHLNKRSREMFRTIVIYIRKTDGVNGVCAAGVAAPLRMLERGPC